MALIVRLFCTLLSVAALVCCASTSVQAQQIWFSPQIPHGGAKGAADWDAMFGPAAPWPKVSAAINVLLISQYYIDDTPDEKLVAQFKFLRDHSIKVALALQGIAANPRCRGANEGFGPPEDSVRMIGKLQRLGLRLDYVRLDEPVWFGHYYADPGACKYSSHDLVRQVMVLVRLYLDAFPDIEVGEVEPVPVMTAHQDWRQFQAEWLQEFASVSGRRIAFLHTEVHTLIPAWRKHLQELAQFARDHETPFGVIYNSSGPDHDDAEWVRHAINLFEETESDLAILPDQAVFQTWESRPSRILPEDQPLTLSHVVSRYLLPRTKLAVSLTDDGLRGQVRSASGPIGNAVLDVSALGADPSRPLPALKLSGTVPAGARSALVGVRLNVECNCDGASDVVIGTMTYEDAGGKRNSSVLPMNMPVSASEKTRLSISKHDWHGADASRVIAAPGGHLVYNSVPFAVSPGQDYAFLAHIGNLSSAGLFGYATIIWFDAQDHAVSREFLWAPRSEWHVATLRTDADGHFSLAHRPARNAQAYPLVLRLMGSDTYRGAYLPVH